MRVEEPIANTQSSRGTKTCPICGENIQLAARKCIHCEQFIPKTWTGFHGKTLWDVLGLLIVPVVLVVGGFLLDRAATERQNELSEDRTRANILQAYFDKMAELLLLEGDVSRADKSSIADIARSKTITTLLELDGPRKGLVLQLLSESDLIFGETALVSLRGADLHGANLRGANLSTVDLFGSNLSGANLQNAKLRGTNLRSANLGPLENWPAADLRWADLFEANLIGANLSGADLRGSDLRRADLFEASLREADLRGADLHGAFLEAADLEDADLRDSILCETTMPDGNILDRDCDSVVQTVPIVRSSDIVGEYEVSGTNPGTDARYQGVCWVKETKNNTLEITWSIMEHEFHGNGILTDHGRLYVSFKGPFEGDAEYTLMSNGSISGTWRGGATPIKSSIDTGTEIWLPLKR